MGESFRHEFSLGGVDTGRRTPPTTVNVPGGLPGIPLDTQMTVPGQPIMRPSFLQAFLANLGPALAGGLAPEPGQPFGTGLGGAFKGIQNQQQINRQYELQARAEQRAEAQSAQSIAASQQQQQQQKALFPGELEKQQIDLQRLKGIMAIGNNPAAVHQ